MTTLRVAIASDIHAHESALSDTHVTTEPPASRPRQHPLSDAIAFAHRKQLKADYLLIPGDITNQANEIGLAYAWRKLHELAGVLDARLLAVPGNHDIVTRTPASDRRAPLSNLVPSFPTGNQLIDEHFSSRGWSLIDATDHRILLLDSTVDFPAFPSNADKNSEEWRSYLHALDRGSFPARVEDELDAILNSLEPKLNLALVHHHPQEHQLVSHLQDTYGPMLRGGELINTLSRYPSGGRWIVIHGHKHIPQLTHGMSASSNGPLVLCAASLGGKLWDPINTVTRNQFHILSATNDALTGTPSIRGRVESYTWGFGEGWAESERSGAGLPAVSGFGCSDDFRVIATKLMATLDEVGRDFMNVVDLEVEVPQLPFMLPVDFAFLEIELEAQGFAFQRDRYNRIVQFVREVAR